MTCPTRFFGDVCFTCHAGGIKACPFRVANTLPLAIAELPTVVYRPKQITGLDHEDLQRIKRWLEKP